ncbi:hypothetical protein L3X38_042194 [Prunus dulcis]|uniref:Uncharacterized protein n=1 Tax=Prunus dulcis TaxID=3755 RepID=A0AAD4UU33_PRUDU|nr:hypothetical protein L3X38_042194 [Prunus dulcis]
MEVAEEQVADETTAEEDDPNEGTADEVASDLADQAVGATEQIAASDEHVAKLGEATKGAAWAGLSCMLGTEPVSGSFMGHIFGGDMHFIVMESPSLLEC